jgi:hypothetical protein
VHSERVTVLLLRLERLALNETGLEALHEAKELLTILGGWSAARRAGLKVELDDDDKATVYRRINQLNDTIDALERARGSVAP